MSSYFLKIKRCFAQTDAEFSYRQCWYLFDCISENAFMVPVRGKGIVSGIELEKVEVSISKQVPPLELDYVEYYIVRKNGPKLPVVDYCVLDTPDEKSFLWS